MPAKEDFSWVQFSCAFLIAGFAAFWQLAVFFEGMWVSVTLTLAVATLCGILAGRYGDSAWRTIVNILRWM
jgi:hypothetical protein